MFSQKNVKDKQFLLLIRNLPINAEKWSLEDQLSKFEDLKTASILLNQALANPLTIELEADNEKSYYKLLNHESHFITISKKEKRNFFIEKVSRNRKKSIKKYISDISKCVFISYFPRNIQIRLLLEIFSNYGKIKIIYSGKFDAETEYTGVVVFEDSKSVIKIMEKINLFLNKFKIKIHRWIPENFLYFTKDFEDKENKKTENIVENLQEVRKNNPKKRFSRTMRFFQSLVQASMEGCSLASKELKKMREFGTARMVIFKNIDDVCFSNGIYGAIRNSPYVDVNHYDKNVRFLKP